MRAFEASPWTSRIGGALAGPPQSRTCRLIPLALIKLSFGCIMPPRRPIIAFPGHVASLPPLAYNSFHFSSGILPPATLPQLVHTFCVEHHNLSVIVSKGGGLSSPNRSTRIETVVMNPRRKAEHLCHLSIAG